MNLRAIKWYLNAIISPCGLLINVLLLFLIKNKSSKNLENYKKVLYMGCITDIIYGIFMIASQPSMALIQGIYFVFMEGIPGNFPHFWSTWIHIPNLFIVYFSVTNAPIQFLYRYLLLCWEIKLGTMAFLGLILIAILACSGYTSVWVATILRRGNKDELYYAPLLNGTEFIIDGQQPKYGTFPISELMEYEWVCLSIIAASYVVVWFCAISIFIKLKKINSQFSQQAMKYQNQINIVLIVEALTPFITVVVPIALDIVIAYLGVHLYWAGQAITLITSLSPTVNGLVKITVITCYRRTVLDFVFNVKEFAISSVFGEMNQAIPLQNTSNTNSIRLGGEVADESSAARCLVKIV